MKKVKNIRIQISITSELQKVLKDISFYAKTPSSKIAGSVLEEALPVFKELLVAFKTAEKDKAKAMAMIQDTANKALVSGARDVAFINSQQGGK